MQTESVRGACGSRIFHVFWRLTLLYRTSPSNIACILHASPFSKFSEVSGCCRMTKHDMFFAWRYMVAGDHIFAFLEKGPLWFASQLAHVHPRDSTLFVSLCLTVSTGWSASLALVIFMATWSACWSRTLTPCCGVSASLCRLQDWGLTSLHSCGMVFRR